MADNNKIYTNEEFKELSEFEKTITTHIPEAKAGYVWGNYRKIKNTTENQPCMCGSAAGHWRKAMDAIRTYVKENAELYNG